jgi:hypothetical protein
MTSPPYGLNPDIIGGLLTLLSLFGLGDTFQSFVRYKDNEHMINMQNLSEEFHAGRGIKWQGWGLIIIIGTGSYHRDLVGSLVCHQE